MTGISSANNSHAYNLYRNVMDEVAKNIKEAFINEGLDEKVISELRALWEDRLKASGAVKCTKQDQPMQDSHMNIYPHSQTTSKSKVTSDVSTPVPSLTTFLEGSSSKPDPRIRLLATPSVQNTKKKTSSVPVDLNSIHSQQEQKNISQTGYKSTPANQSAIHSQTLLAGNTFDTHIDNSSISSSTGKNNSNMNINNSSKYKPVSSALKTDSKRHLDDVSNTHYTNSNIS